MCRAEGLEDEEKFGFLLNLVFVSSSQATNLILTLNLLTHFASSFFKASQARFVFGALVFLDELMRRHNERPP
jgi:hypothetical protein